MTRVQLLALGFALVTIVGIGLGAQDRTTTAASADAIRTKIDVSKLGPQVGQLVPDFSLTDQHGKIWTLPSIMGPKGTMLVFYRSADWCPYCKTQLLELQSQVKQLQQQGLGLAAISYDPPDVTAAFSAQHGITFPLLSDVGSATIKRYGILNTVAEEALGAKSQDPDVVAQAKVYVAAGGVAARMRGIPFPGTFVLDRQGRVKSRFFEDSYVVRNTVSNILLTLDGGTSEVTGTRISTEHLEITTYPTDRAVAPGNRFSVVLEITPKPGMHVYAPGASGYRVITLKVPPGQPVRPLRLSFPPSEVYEFKPLNERVPVYQKPFSLRQELLLEGDQQARAALRDKDALTVSASLDYQACDDKICFNPVSVPLSWTLGLRSIVTQPTAPTR